jgi:hypothetical protein
MLLKIRVAAMQAEQRQKTFKQSAVGRAAYQAEQKARQHTTPQRPNQTAQDWIS